jgi:CTP synthase
LDLRFIHSEKLTDENAEEYLSDLDGILVAPGFGQRGIEGKFAALKYAREHDKPTFGVCLGMQCMVIEYARNVLGLTGANSTEFEPNAADKIIDLMEEQKHLTLMGATMRLGAYDCLLEKDSIAYKAYRSEQIRERHRHRYELNNEYKALLEANGMKCTGINPESGLVEVVEVPALKWYVGVQYHPEYNSTVAKPNPLFMSFIEAATK